MSLAGTLRGLPPESRMSGGAAAALVASMFLPWYQVSFFRGSDAVTDSRSALQVFTWVEAAILLVALAVLYLVWARSQRQAFHLPGGDGFVVSAAGAWVLALIVWRLFDKPGVDERAATVGIQWGIFFSLLAAGALVGAGARVRAAGRPEPPNPVAEEPGWEVPVRRERARPANGRPRTGTAVTEILGEGPPAWQGEPPEAPGRAEPRPPAPPAEPPPSRRRRRSRAERSDDTPPDRLF